MVRSHSPDDVAKFAEAVGNDLPGVADALRRCFGFDACSLEAAEPTAFADTTGDGFEGPGVVVTLDVGDDRMAVLVPDTLPLPGWVTEPGEDEQARLQSLAVDWSALLLPPETKTTATGIEHVGQLWSVVEQGDPDDSARVIDLTVDLGETEAGASVRIAWPLVAVKGETTEDEAEPAADATTPPAPEPASAASVAPAFPPAPATSAAKAQANETLRRLSGIRVPLSVRLAEKQIDVRQLIELTPGALVTFEKNCEAPLELYVNNRPFAVGEAVKIGEKFGLKIDEYAYE